MTAPTLLPQPFGTVAHFAQALRKASDQYNLYARFLGAVDALVEFESKDIVEHLRNLLEAERIVAAELDERDNAAEYAPEGRTTAALAAKPDTLGVAFGHHTGAVD